LLQQREKLRESAEMLPDNTPLESGFLMPAEWEQHEGTWLQWSHDDTHENVQMRVDSYQDLTKLYSS
jgi:agmatine/peptidylarginine deiminase